MLSETELLKYYPVWDPFSSVQFSRSVMSDSLQPHGLQQARPPLSITNSQSLPKLMSIQSVMPSNHLILCHPLLLPPSILASIRVFSNESALCIRVPKYWSFSFNISPSNEYSGLISFRMDWFHLLAVQGTLKCLLQHHSSKASILRCSAFFIVQLPHPISSLVVSFCWHKTWFNHSCVEVKERRWLWFGLGWESSGTEGDVLESHWGHALF